MKRIAIVIALLIGNAAYADAEFDRCEAAANAKADDVATAVAMMTCLRQQSQRQLAAARAAFGAQDTAPFKNWTLGIRPDRLTGNTIVQMFTTSTGSIDCGGTKAHVDLALRCQDDTTILTIGGPACFFVSDFDRYGTVAYRVDDAAPKTIQMTESTDNEVLGLWKGRQSIPVIKQLFDGSTMLVRLTPYKGRPTDIEFNITGVETVIRDLRKACHW